MKKVLVIENCMDCPFFINAFATFHRESCMKTHKEIPYNLTDRGYPIPDFCPLAIDNSTMPMILRETISEIEVLEDENRDLRNKLDKIRNILK